MKTLPMKRTLGFAALFAVTSLTITACGQEFGTISDLAPAKKKFNAALVGTNEVPAVTTTAAGTMELIQEDSVTILYTLATTSRLDSLTMAHVHAAAAGSNGPIMAWFFPSEAARAPGTGGGTAAAVNGVIRVGRLSRAGTAFVAPFTWDSLLVRMNAGTSYVNVHTRRFGGGEIRGQITAAAP